MEFMPENRENSQKSRLMETVSIDKGHIRQLHNRNGNAACNMQRCNFNVIVIPFGVITWAGPSALYIGLSGTNPDRRRPGTQEI